MQILIAWLGRSISFVLFYGPRWLRSGLALILATLWYDVFRIRRQVVTDNIAIAFPEMSLPARVRMGRRSLYSLALNLVEYCYLPWLNKGNFEHYFRTENIELLEQYLGEKRGLILLTLHLGHGDLACAGLSLRGLPIVMISKFFKWKWLNDMWFGMRERLGTRFIAPRDSSYALLKAIKQGSAVIIPLDQFTGPPIGVRTTFFGKETGTAAGLALMAMRSGAPVVSVYTYRDKVGKHVLHVERHLPVENSREPEALTRTTQMFNYELEEFVRRHPEQWMWIHRRWKTFKY